MKPPRDSLASLFALGLFALPSPGATGAPTQPGSVVISRCDQPFLFGFGTVDVVLSGIELVPPTEALRAERTKLRSLQAQEAEQVRQAAEARENARRKLLETGALHPADGPEVRQVSRRCRRRDRHHFAGGPTREQSACALRG